MRITFRWVVPESFSGPAFFELDNVLARTNPTAAGSIALHAAVYNCSDTVVITMADSDLATMATTDVTVTTDGGDSETVALLEQPGILGAGGLDETITWADPCAAEATALGARMTCNLKVNNRLVQQAIFKPTGVPNLFDLKVSVRRRAFSPPLGNGPVTAIVSTNTFVRRDTIGESGGCQLSGGRSQKLNCRERGVVP